MWKFFLSQGQYMFLISPFELVIAVDQVVSGTSAKQHHYLRFYYKYWPRRDTNSGDSDDNGDTQRLEVCLFLYKMASTAFTLFTPKRR